MRIFLVLPFVFLTTFLFSQDHYEYFIDLTNVYDDQLEVELIPPGTSEDDLILKFPAIVPGTYSLYNFGRFITNVRAENEAGNLLEVEKKDKNTWVIPNAKEVKKIRYRVKDSWDEKGGKEVFQPAGTNIEDGLHFLINHHGFFGYLDGKRNLEYRLRFKKPKGFYASTSLVPSTTNDTQDEFRVANYDLLVDSPIMYCLPDTSFINLGNAEVLVSIYSEGDDVTATMVAKEIRSVLEAQKEYLGGELPIKKYAFIIYLFDGWNFFGAYGALEHNRSSVYFLPLTIPEMIGETVKDMAAHEFFHIRTPLGIHSEEIHNFDFDEPDMSKHLWLYEGVTEYSAMHVQVKSGLITLEDFLDELRVKVVQADGYNDTVPFTILSERILGPYEDQYMNVYAKGALIAMCLDIKLLSRSNGRYDLNDLLDDLWEEYGPDKPFQDDSLFAVIGRLTNKDIQDFLEVYVGGPYRIPYADILQEAGIYYNPEVQIEKFSLGGADVAFNDEGKIVVYGISDLDEFGDKIGYKRGDIIEEFNGQEITAKNGLDVFSEYFENAEEGDPFELVVSRKKKKNGKRVKVKLKTKVMKIRRTRYHVFELIDEPTADQAAILRAWLGDIPTK